MSGISNITLFGVNQLRARFVDDIGNCKIVLGTGFWMGNSPLQYFVTNKHNIDPRLKLGIETKYKLESIEIKLRRVAHNNWTEHTESFFINDLQCVKMHETADVAVLVKPTFTNQPQDFSAPTMTLEALANDQFFNDRLDTMDVASFIGFPGTALAPWYDTRWQLPIARTINIASFAQIPFSNDLIKTSDVLLVSGFSFAGSSGSPVLTHEKFGHNEHGGPMLINPTVIGIMSGHWHEHSPDGWEHSGLSYLTRSTSISQLLSSI